MLLGMAASRLAFSSVGSAHVQPTRIAPSTEIKGSVFLRKILPGSGEAVLERHREFARRVMLDLEQIGATGVSKRVQTPLELDEWLRYFKSMMLPQDFLKFFEDIAAKIKESPEAKRKKMEARRRGGLVRVVQLLAEHLRSNGGIVHVDDLIERRRYSPVRIEELVSKFPERFEKVMHRGLLAVRLKDSKKTRDRA
jgi:hypothetical protein